MSYLPGEPGAGLSVDGVRSWFPGRVNWVSNRPVTNILYFATIQPYILLFFPYYFVNLQIRIKKPHKPYDRFQNSLGGGIRLPYV